MTRTTTTSKYVRKQLQSIPWPTKYISTPGNGFDAEEVYQRQEAIPDYDTTALRKATLLGIGAGGLGSAIYPNLIRKGLVKFILADADVVEFSNLNRQYFFSGDAKHHAGKAFALAKNVAKHSLLGCEIVAHRVDFGPNSALKLLAEGVSLAYCGVDNDQTRVYASQLFRRLGIPCVLSGVSENADYGYVFRAATGGSLLGLRFSRPSA